MSLFVVSRRKIVFQQSLSGPSIAIYVPGADQVQILKDTGGSAAVKPVKAGAQNTNRGPQLSRVNKGLRTIYGQLPNELRERRERLKVWLAEDLAPAEAEAFFFVFTPQVIVHGVRERNDEGKLVWRTAQLVLPKAADETKPLETALADYMFANQGQNVCVAVVNELKLFRTVQQLATPLGLTPVPISTLKPVTGTAPLYSHLDFTWAYVLLMMMVIAGVLSVAGYYIVKQQEALKIEAQIHAIETQINSVEINPRVGHIRQAQTVVASIRQSFSRSPADILAAAGEVVVPFGSVESIKLGFTPPERLQALGIQPTSGQEPVEVAVVESKDVLLADQAARAAETLTSAPWVRQMVRFGEVGLNSTFILMLAIDQAGIEPNGEAQP